MIRNGKIAVAAIGWTVRLLSLATVLSFCDASRAADWTPGPGGEDLAGVPCKVGGPFWGPILPTAEILPWASVWLGHFSGGRPYADPYGQILIDWHDEKICFPSRAACQSWMRDMRRAYHQPEGFWTCLILR
jgi:hypothetical protein